MGLARLDNALRVRIRPGLAALLRHRPMSARTLPRCQGPYRPYVAEREAVFHHGDPAQPVQAQAGRQMVHRAGEGVMTATKYQIAYALTGMALFFAWVALDAWLVYKVIVMYW